MKKLEVYLVALLVVLYLAPATMGEIYKWVDDNGVIHFSDSPPQDIGSKTKVESIPTRRPDPQAVSDPERAIQQIGGTSYSSPEPVEKPERHEAPMVELYTTRWCPYCQKARDFFRSRGIPFAEYDIERDRDAAILKGQLDKRRGVPLAVINGRPIHGFNEAMYERALRSR